MACEGLLRRNELPAKCQRTWRLLRRGHGKQVVLTDQPIEHRDQWSTTGPGALNRNVWNVEIHDERARARVGRQQP
ncbi:hypothetical protein D3C83_36370 [compost metagenome]